MLGELDSLAGKSLWGVIRRGRRIAGCSMDTKSETFEIKVGGDHGNEITVTYDTIDGEFHTGAYAQITNAQVVKNTVRRWRRMFQLQPRQRQSFGGVRSRRRWRWQLWRRPIQFDEHGRRPCRPGTRLHQIWRQRTRTEPHGSGQPQIYLGQQKHRNHHGHQRKDPAGAQ